MRIIKSIIASSAVLCSLCVHAGKNYYVDAENGNDLWDGSTSVEPTPEQQLLDPIPGPKKTLAAAMAIPGLTSGDIVYAAEGSYTSETMENSSALYRVVVPQGVRLIASGKAENTYIVGESSPVGTEGNDGLGNGPGAVRCAYLDKNAHIIGFTLTGGRTPTTARGAACSGGAVYGTRAYNYVTDCIVSNNMAYYYGGAFHKFSVLTRCVIAGNRAYGDIGNSMSGGIAYGCFCKDSGSGAHFFDTKSYSCTFVGPGMSVRYGSTYNCISLVADGQGGANTKIYNSYLVSVSAGVDTNDCVKTTVGALALDENGRPGLNSIAIDAGNPNYYSISDMGDTDIYGTPRILNGVIDVGAYEYDWRPSFAAELGKRFTMTYASPSVTTNATGGLLVPDGAIAGTAIAAGPYEFKFEVTGGSVAVSVAGEVVGGSSGTGAQSIFIDVPDRTSEIRYAFTPDAENPGVVILRKFASARGFSFRIR